MEGDDVDDVEHVAAAPLMRSATSCVCVCVCVCTYFLGHFVWKYKKMPYIK